jgi:type VI secretion system secreted protein VgrG
MSSSFVQAESRLLHLTTPLGGDVLLLTGFTGREEMSRLFAYDLEMLSENDNIAAKEIVGKAVGWSVSHINVEPRNFHGMVKRFTAGPRTFRQYRSYRAEVVPWLWFLTRTMDCRIFQNKTAPEIIEQIFKDFSFTDYQLNTSRSYEKRVYCVQYRETAFNFVSRLMEEEGLFYFFVHDKSKHTLVIGDRTSHYKTCSEGTVIYDAGSRAENHITTWDHRYEFRSGKWAFNDYNFETPSTSLLANTSTLVDLPNISKYELYDYPGLYMVKADGDGDAKIRIEEEECPYNLVVGASRNCTFTPGHKFTLDGHEVDAENGGYLVTMVEHSATDESIMGGGGASEYSNTFSCIPSSVVFRPERITRKPFVQGPQTALVVGPKGEEIYTDKYGRVKVHFYWDRYDKKDENSSCWIRVSENWAGNKWGIVFNPRIGQEVVVDFLEGDPDRPLITGRVYNAEQMPPYELPTHQSKSVIKTRSTKEGTPDEFNELYFEDKKGEELIYFHAQKNFIRYVENNDTLTVGWKNQNYCDDGSQKIDIWNNQETHIGYGLDKCKEGNQKITIFNNQVYTIGEAKCTLGTQTMQIWNCRDTVVGYGKTDAKLGSQTLKVWNNDDTVIGFGETSCKDGSQTLKVFNNQDIVIGSGNGANKDGSQTITIWKDQTFTLKTGNRTETIDMGNDKLQIKMGNRSCRIDMGNDELKLGMGNQTIKLDLGSSKTEAMQSIELKVGSSSIKLDQMGVTIKGMMIKIEGTIQTDLKGLMTNVTGTAMLKAGGAIVMIG